MKLADPQTVIKSCGLGLGTRFDAAVLQTIRPSNV
jgi:hypothetical protein